MRNIRSTTTKYTPIIYSIPHGVVLIPVQKHGIKPSRKTWLLLALSGSTSNNPSYLAHRPNPGLPFFEHEVSFIWVYFDK